jgi:O-antigen/teichoic acid export membrane protein
MPLVVKNIDKVQVADWNILLPTGLLLAAVVTFGMDSATVRYLKDAEDEKQKAVIFSTGFFFEAFLALLLAGCLVLASGQVGAVLNLSENQTSSWIVLMGWLPGIIMAQYFQNWFKYTFRRSLFVKLIAIQAGVYLGGIIFLKATNRLSLVNVMLVMLASQWLTALAGFLTCRRLFTFQVNKKLLKQLLIYGLPFMIFAFGFNFILSLDRYVLAGRISKEDFAVYTQTVRIAAIITMIVSSFNFAFGPFSLSLLGKPDAEKTFSRFHSYYLIIMSFLGLSFLAFGKVIINIFAGPDYIGGYNFLLFFVSGYILYGLYSFAQLGIIYSKKSYLGIYVLMAGAAACGITDLLLVKKYGGYGTATGFLVANLVMVLLGNFYSAKHLHVKYNLAKDIFLMLLFVITGYGFMKVSFSDNIVVDGMAKFAGLLVVMPVVFFFLLTSEEKNYLRRIVFRNNP